MGPSPSPNPPRKEMPTLVTTTEESSFENHHSITTAMSDDSGSFGCMFDAEASHDTITITGMEILTRSMKGSYVRVQLFTKHGTHKGYEDKSTAWTEVGSAVIVSQGADDTTPLPMSFFNEANKNIIMIEPSTVHAFFILLKEPNLRYTKGNRSTNDGRVKIHSGS
eukprot:12606324-Ditylum_brightwellii.AAC.1